MLGLKPTSVRNVRKALKSLVDTGWVARIERGNNKKHQANKYQLRIVGESIVSNRPCTEVTRGPNETSAEGHSRHSTGSYEASVEGVFNPANIPAPHQRTDKETNQTIPSALTPNSTSSELMLEEDVAKDGLPVCWSCLSRTLHPTKGCINPDCGPQEPADVAPEDSWETFTDENGYVWKHNPAFEF